MVLVKVSFLPQFFPGGLCIFSDNFGLFQFASHSFNFSLHFRIFVFDVCNQTNAQILESALFLELVPLLLKYVHCLMHFNLGQEVPNEVVNYNVPLDCFGHHCAARVEAGALRNGFAFVRRFCFKRIEVIEVLVAV